MAIARLLFIDDSPQDRLQALATLRRDLPSLDPQEVEGPGPFEQAFHGPPPDIIVSELHFSWTDGRTLLRRLRAHWPFVPIVLHTAGVGEDIEARVVRERLVEHVPKDESGRRRLSAVVRAALEAAAHERAASELRAALDAIPSPILLVDAAGMVQFCNAPASALSSCDRESLPRSVDAFTVREPWHTGAIAMHEALGTDRPATRVARDALADRSWEVTATPIVATSGRQVLLLARETTELVHLQDVIVRNETATALGTLVAGVAHEVRSPLFGISATLDALQMRLHDDADLGRYFGNLRSELDRLNALMRGLMEYGRPDAGPYQRQPLRPVVVAAVQAMLPFAERSGVRIEMPGAQDPVVEMDERRIRQAVDHVLDNAVRHTPAGGVVSVALAEGAHGGAAFAEVVVDDGGTGFAPDDLARACMPFFTRRPGGVGLGLAITKRIVEDHGGRIIVSNRAGAGARVRLALPLLPGQEAVA